MQNATNKLVTIFRNGSKALNRPAWVTLKYGMGKNAAIEL